MTRGGGAEFESGTVGTCRTSPGGVHDLPSSSDGDVVTVLPADARGVHHLDVGSLRSPCAVVTLASLGREVGSLARTPRLIAIDGRAGAGKSRFASALIPFCGDVALVRVDDFLWWGDIETWWPRLREEALEPLLAGRAARFRARDWEHNPLGRAVAGNVVIEPAGTVIIEGVTSSRQDVADRLDLAFSVEAPQDTRLAGGSSGTARTCGGVGRTGWFGKTNSSHRTEPSRGRTTSSTATLPSLTTPLGRSWCSPINRCPYRLVPWRAAICQDWGRDDG